MAKVVGFFFFFFFASGHDLSVHVPPNLNFILVKSPRLDHKNVSTKSGRPKKKKKQRNEMNTKNSILWDSTFSQIFEISMPLRS